MSQAAAHHGEITATGVPSYKLAMWTFLGSECFFFGSLIGTYMSTRGKSVVGPFPIDVFDPAVTSISTFDLLVSSLTMALAVYYAKRGDMAKVFTYIGLTMVGGVIFLGFQVYEFSHFVHEGLTLQQNIFGASFFTLTGFHGAHVTVGVLLLGSLAWAIRGNHLSDVAATTEMIGLYWHFVDIVWILIFTLVYLLEYA